MHIRSDAVSENEKKKFHGQILLRLRVELRSPGDIQRMRRAQPVRHLLFYNQIHRKMDSPVVTLSLHVSGVLNHCTTRAMIVFGTSKSTTEYG